MHVADAVKYDVYNDNLGRSVTMCHGNVVQFHSVCVICCRASVCYTFAYNLH